jgi:hypothetical protein
MARKLVSALLVAVVVLGIAALISTPVGARGCKPDPNPNGRDHCSIRCAPCYQLVCIHGGRCPYLCAPIPGCTP